VTPVAVSPAGRGNIDALRRHLQQKPNDGRAWLALGHALMAHAPGPELSHAVGQCLRYLPDSPQAWLLAATVQQRARGAEAALLLLEQAAARNPDRPAPQLAMARLRLNQFQLVEALAAVNHVIETFGATADALSTRGDINLQGAHWDEALADYREVQKAGGNDASLLHQIGCCYFGLGDHPSAEAHFRKAIKRDPRQVRSRYTLALSLLKRLEPEKAKAALAEVVRTPGGDPQVRRRAATALAALAEHRRLDLPLRHALESGDPGALQAALNDTPDALLQHDEKTLERFRRLAAIFRSHPFDPRVLGSPGSAEPRAFLEAETLCTADIDPATLAELFQRLPGLQADDPSVDRGLLDCWRTVRDRAAFDAGLLQAANGEAWLRYWHARLLGGIPNGHPGQFKAVDAAILGKPQISPELISPLCRAVLAELLPGVPAGMARALFLYASLKVLQPFIDGNSRLARFLLNAELEASGLPTVVVPVSWSSRMNSGLDALIFEGRLEPLIESLVGAQREASHQLGLFHDQQDGLGRT